MTTLATLQQEELLALNQSIRTETADLVSQLRDKLGAQLVAYIAGVGETRAVREWADGERTPRAETLRRLRDAYRVTTFLERHESRRTIHAWFQGMNPLLEDRSPARTLRDGSETEATAVMVAARTLAAAA
jgi:hypothetical protein